MPEIMQVLQSWVGAKGEATAFSDDKAGVTRREFAARIAGHVGEFRDLPDTIGLFGPNGIDWAIALLAAWTAGKTVVPLPSFFSRQQLEHICRDAGIEHIILTRDAGNSAAAVGLAQSQIHDRPGEALPSAKNGAGIIVYTSGSTGQPKGVRFRLEQLEWQARTLATAIDASPRDAYLSVLPLPLLLETIAAICVPMLVEARTHFASAIAESLGASRPADLLSEVAARKPTTMIVVPQLLASWVAQLEAKRQTAPDSLRFVAVGGAPIAEALVKRAWHLGIPVHEGYGLTECCSVVALNRPGCRKPGTAGKPLPGVRVCVEDGELVVSGPAIMERYVRGGSRTDPTWRTGDLGTIDQDGCLRVSGRKDSLLVMASGRNVSPEWVEAMVLADPRIAACAVLGHGESQLSVLLIPSAVGERWLIEAPRAHILLWLEQICIEAPAYAVPRDFVICPGGEGRLIGLLTSNGRISRIAAARAYPALKLAQHRVAACASSNIKINQGSMEGFMPFYDRLIAETERERTEFASIPLISEALRSGASRELYLDFLTQAYHHVKHTFPLLAFAAARTSDEIYQDALVEYMEEERGHEKWILNDIVAFGGDAAAVRDGAAGIACQVMVGYTYYAIEWISPYAMLGSVHVLEGMSTLLADKAADAIQRSIGRGGKVGFSYLRSHGALDIEHVAFFKKLVDRIEDRKIQQIVIDASKVFYRLYGDIYHELATRHPVKSHAA
jgi:long-chain acyl-CoA synthetase